MVECRRFRSAGFELTANYDATVANYRESSLAAFQQVEDNLAALRIVEQEMLQQKEVVAEARRGVRLFTDRYEGGVNPYLQVVSAQTIALLNERNEVDILRRRMETSVLLIKGLGGGWDAATLPTIDSMH